MVSDVTRASVGLWKNCTNGGCDDVLSYASEGTSERTVFGTGDGGEQGSVQPARDCLA